VYVLEHDVILLKTMETIRPLTTHTTAMNQKSWTSMLTWAILHVGTLEEIRLGLQNMSSRRQQGEQQI
jgi:hypothetical protein